MVVSSIRAGRLPVSGRRRTDQAYQPNVNFTEKGCNGTILEEPADVAQLVEQLIRNQQVVSSSLTVGSIESVVCRMLA